MPPSIASPLLHHSPWGGEIYPICYVGQQAVTLPFPFFLPSLSLLFPFPLGHMEVPSLGVKLGCSCRPTPQPRQQGIWAASVTYTTVHGNARSWPIQWSSPGIEPTSSLVPMWLWCRPAAAAPVWPLTWELPYAACVALKDRKKKKKRIIFRDPQSNHALLWLNSPTASHCS